MENIMINRKMFLCQVIMILILVNYIQNFKYFLYKLYIYIHNI